MRSRERAAGDVFEDQIERLVRVADEVVDGDEVRVAAHARARLRLAREAFFEAAELVGIGGVERAAERLDGDAPLEAGIEGHHDRAEAALAEQPVDAIAVEQEGRVSAPSVPPVIVSSSS